ncbi:MAG: hypothetical protein KDA42_01330 [Planctomycetales bacterium]|nr:hypothetical protein [Planctomycetales bacterium]
MNRLRELQQRRNLDCRDQWLSYAEHRHQVMQQLAKSAGGRLCILGAGNCNDIDLASLLAAFNEVHLVDLDATALADGVARQSVEDERLHAYGDVEVTGVWELLEQVAADGLEVTRADLLAQSLADAPALPMPGPFDCVVSLCLLSQLIDAVSEACGRDDSRVNDLVLKARDQHLRLLAELTTQGGTSVLVSDFVSSDTCPELLTIPSSDLPRAAQQALATGNFFTGLNPAAIASRIAKDPTMFERFGHPRIAAPWRWRLGDRMFAVFAMHWSRQSNSAPDC